ncbi:conserved hypothetical protein [Burkholderia pseudomallei 576]|nr:conserved hypothetical protein [Burkholderia pseudomallei 576]
MRRTRYCSRLRPDASGWAPGGRHRGCPFGRRRARRRAWAPCVSDGDFRFSSVGFAFSRCSRCGARRSMPCFRYSVLGIGAGAGASIWHSAIGTQFPALGSRADSVRYPTFAVGPLRRTERRHTKICDESNLLRASPMSSRAIASRSGSMRASVTYRRFVSSAPGDIRAKREPGGRAAAAAGTNTGAPSCEWRACDCAPRTPDADRASRGNTRCAAGATRAASR